MTAAARAGGDFVIFGKAALLARLTPRIARPPAAQVPDKDFVSSATFLA